MNRPRRLPLAVGVEIPTGRDSLTGSAPAGCAPPEPRTVDVPPGEIAEVVVELEREP